MSTTWQTDALGTKTRDQIRRDLPALNSLPPVPFERTELDKVQKNQWRQWRRLGILVVVGKRENEHGTVQCYDLADDAREFLKEQVERATLTPCGHRGVSCVESGTTYSCTYDACSRIFDRATAKEVLASL